MLLGPSSPAFASKPTRSLVLILSSRRPAARSRNWSLAHWRISLPCVSRIECQKDPFAAVSFGGATPLRVVVEAVWTEADIVLMWFGYAGVVILIVTA